MDMQKVMVWTALLAFLDPAYALEGVVKIESGLLAGGSTYIRYYKGVSYAAPPVGGYDGNPRSHH